MKKTTISLLATLAALSVQAAPVQGGANAGSRVSISNPDSNLVLDSSTGIFYRFLGSPTLSSIEAKNGESVGEVNVNGAATVDATSGASAIKADGWTQVGGALTLTNSNDTYNNENIAVDFGKLLTIDNTVAGYNSTTQAVNFKHFKGTVSATQTNIGDFATGSSSITIDADSYITWKGNGITVGATASGSGNASLNVNGTLALDAQTSMAISITRGSFNIGETGTVRMANRTLNVGDGGVVNVNGTLVFAAGSRVNLKGEIKLGENASLSNIYNVQSTGKFTQTSTTNTGLNFRKENSLNAGSDWTLVEYARVMGYDAGGSYGIQESVLSVFDGAKVVIKNKSAGARDAKVLLAGFARLELYKENAFVDENGKSVRLAATTAVVEMGNVVNIRAKQTFKDIWINSNSGTTTINLIDEDASILYLDGTGDENFSTINIQSENANLMIFGFRDKSIYIGTSETSFKNLVYLMNNGKLEIYDTNDELVSASQISCKDGWLRYNIPEPAEWAAVFGAIALGLAVYRRRK